MQNFANHVRYHPIHHFFILPVLAINVIVRIVVLVERPGAMTGWELMMALALASLAVLVRVNPLVVQSRIIRLEETLRMHRVLPPEMQPRIAELKNRQIVALRFAPDDELTELTRAVLAGEIQTPKEIKQRVRNWRGDTFRV